jgi:hypothetical protein
MTNITLHVLIGLWLTTLNFGPEKTVSIDKKSPEVTRLEQFVGKWITAGSTAGDAASKPLGIQSTDIYEWAPGGNFIIHHTYGRIGSVNVASLEIIGYDIAEKKYKSHYFGGDGSTSINDLIFENGKWYWQAQAMRGNGIFSADGRQLIAHHEKLDNKGKWVPSMEVILNKVE